MKVRKSTAILLETSIFLLVTGIVLTSYELVALSAFPLILLVLPHIPVKVEVINSTIEGGRYVGEPFSVRIVLKTRGFGLLKVQHVLPEHFEIAEGSNAIADFVIGGKTIHLDYRAIPTKRGFYRLDRIVFESENPLLTGRKHQGEVKTEIELEVRHKIQKILKVGVVRGIAKSPMPDVDISKIGVPGTDFREIREYVPGDPVKFINWKATARKNSLMVNQYEVEGKKAVWIFLDANNYMAHGTTIKNFLEAAIEAANSLAYYYTSRGYKVGLYVVGHGHIIYPDVGKRQFRRISETLMRVDVSDKSESLDQAIEACKGFLINYKPLMIFITRVEYSKPVHTVLRASRMSKRKRLPVEVIALKKRSDEEYDEFAILVMNALRNSILSRLRARVKVIDWDIDHPLSKVLLKEISTK